MGRGHRNDVCSLGCGFDMLSLDRGIYLPETRK